MANLFRTIGLAAGVALLAVTWSSPEAQAATASAKAKSTGKATATTAKSKSTASAPKKPTSSTGAKASNSATASTPVTKKTVTSSAKAAPAKSSGTQAKASSTPAKATAQAKSAKRTGKQVAKAAPARPRSVSQQQPTSERYQEIQQALVDRGYLTGPADGSWGTDSVAGLKRFQADQNLAADGKLSALSLTALGLGPRRQSAATLSVQSFTAQESPTPAAPLD